MSSASPCARERVKEKKIRSKVNRFLKSDRSSNDASSLLRSQKPSLSLSRLLKNLLLKEYSKLIPQSQLSPFIKLWASKSWLKRLLSGIRLKYSNLLTRWKESTRIRRVALYPVEGERKSLVILSSLRRVRLLIKRSNSRSTMMTNSTWDYPWFRIKF